MKTFTLKLLSGLSVLFAGLSAYAQTDHKISASEIAQMPAYIQQVTSNQSSSVITDPPVSPVRAPAEWEEIQALMVAWTSHTTILREIVRHAREETQVYIVCSDSNAVISSLTAGSVPLSNISFIVAPFNSIWCRDYGQWNIYTNDVDSLALIDWIYNRPRPKDDTVPYAIANQTGLPLYSMTAPPMDLIHTGGNFMVDGFGTAFSSKLVINENPSKTEAEIDTIYSRFMGINRYIKMETLPYDGIHHIDMHMKLLDEETLLVGEYPQGVSDGPQIEANLQYVLGNFNSVYGTPYKVIRIPMPPDGSGTYPQNGGDYRTYTNSVFVNNTVLVPTYAEQYDTTALRIYREALPGYEITGINCNSIIPSSGAIHCITKEVATADPLLISHQPLPSTFVTTGGYTVNARIQHRSGISHATIYYRTDTLQPYQQEAMALTGPGTHTWTGVIPAQPAGTKVYYYIEAESYTGKMQVRPMPAPAGYWHFSVLLNTGIASTPSVEMKAAYPNPSKGITCIPVNVANGDYAVSLRDMHGRMVKTIYSGNISGQKNLFVNTIDISSGIYCIELRGSDSVLVQRLVVR